jgi:hypothetical protein
MSLNSPSGSPGRGSVFGRPDVADREISDEGRFQRLEKQLNDLGEKSRRFCLRLTAHGVGERIFPNRIPRRGKWPRLRSGD